MTKRDFLSNPVTAKEILSAAHRSFGYDEPPPGFPDSIEKLNSALFSPLVSLVRAETERDEAKRDVAILGRALRTAIIGYSVKHGLSDKGVECVAKAFESVFPAGFDDPRLRGESHK
jgi:hypothetical protein